MADADNQLSQPTDSPDLRKKSPGLSPGTWMGILVIVAMLVGWWSMRTQGGRDGTTHAAVGKSLPPFMVVPLVGADQPMTTPDMLGNVNVIQFWGPWCSYCVLELPPLNELRRKYADNPSFRFVSVSCDGSWSPPLPPQTDMGELRESTAKTLQQLGIEGSPVYADPEAITRAKLTQVMSWDGYPTTLIVDRGGTIRGVWVGYRRGDIDRMDDLVKKLLES